MPMRRVKSETFQLRMFLLVVVVGPDVLRTVRQRAVLVSEQGGRAGWVLEFEQEALSIQPSSVPDESAVAADDSVARHDDRQRIPCVRGSYRPHRTDVADLARQAR